MRPSNGFFSTLSLLILTTWAAPTVNNNELGEVSSFHPGRPTSSLQNWDDWKVGYEEPQGPSRLKREHISKRTTGVAKYWSEAECKESIMAGGNDVMSLWYEAKDEIQKFVGVADDTVVWNAKKTLDKTFRDTPGLYDLLVRFTEYYARVIPDPRWDADLDWIEALGRKNATTIDRWKRLTLIALESDRTLPDLEGLRQLAEESIPVVTLLKASLMKVIAEYRALNADY